MLTIHRGRQGDIELLDLPEIYHPYDNELGWDYWKVYFDDGEGSEGVYAKYGIDGEKGCMVVCRPDQHVAYIGDLDDVEKVEGFFSSFLLTRS
jgi:phenol 2-monooxygenase